jgi:hypothetical protein
MNKFDEKVNDILTEGKTPKKITKKEIDQYFSWNGATLRKLWDTNNVKVLKGDDDKWYEAKYGSKTMPKGTGWGEGYIELTLLKTDKDGKPVSKHY